MDLVTNPLKPGKPEMDKDPIMQKTVVFGMERHSPPNSDALIVPTL